MSSSFFIAKKLNFYDRPDNPFLITLYCTTLMDLCKIIPFNVSTLQSFEELKGGINGLFKDERAPFLQFWATKTKSKKNNNRYKIEVNVSNN